MKDFDLTVNLLAKSMDLRIQRHSAISGNIANADTPGYRPKAVSFETDLQKAVQSQQAQKIYGVSSRIEEVDDKVPRLDGNSVSVDKQIANLTENSTVYSVTADFLRKKMGMLKRVIQ